MNVSSSFPEPQEPVRKPRYAWMKGFADIFFSPADAGRRTVFAPGKHLLFAVLLWVCASVVSFYVQQSSAEIRRQQEILSLNEVRMIGQFARIDEARIEEQIAELRKAEQESSALAATIGRSLFGGAINLAVVGVLFWVLQRLFNAEPPTILGVIAVTAYGFAIDSAGLLVSAVSQVAAGSIFATPSLAFLAMPLEKARVWSHSLFGMISVFTVWKYLATGIAVAVFSGLPARRGVLFGLTAFFFIYGALSTLVMVYYWWLTT